MNRKKILGISVSVLLLFASLAYALPPRVSWTPSELKPDSIAPGQSVSYTLILKHTGILPIPATNQLRIVAEGDIVPFVTLTQPTFPPVFKRGNQVTVRVTVSVPTTTPLSVKTGELVLKRILPNGKVKEVWRADALPVELTLWQLFSDNKLGLAIEYPPDWVIRSGGDTTVFSNVSVPAGLSDNALQTESFFEIGLLAGKNPNVLPIEQWFDQFFSRGFSAAPEARTSLIIDGHNAVQIELSEIGKRVHIYVAKQTDVIEIVYGLFAPQFLSEYESILNSLKFTP